MNYIYKTNKYQISLIIIIRIIVFNTIFYIKFCYIRRKNYNNYVYIIKALVYLYNYFNLYYSTTVIFNNNKTLLSMLLYKFFEQEYCINYILCIQYINQNVIANCNFFFYKQEVRNLLQAIKQYYLYRYLKIACKIL